MQPSPGTFALPSSKSSVSGDPRSKLGNSNEEYSSLATSDHCWKVVDGNNA